MKSFIETLHKQGWVKVKSAIPEDEANKMAELARYYARNQNTGSNSPTTTDTSSNGKHAPRKLSEPFFLDTRFRKFLFSSGIQSLITPVLGQKPVLIFDHVFMKPAHFGSRKFWHQDGFYYDLEDVNKGLSVWIALCNADKNNGCMEYYPGSHLGGLCEHNQPNNEPAHAVISSGNTHGYGSPVMVPARKGDIIFHHFHTIHGSGDNISNNDRIAYASHWISVDAKGAGASWNKIYPMRKEYSRLMEEEELYNPTA